MKLPGTTRARRITIRTFTVAVVLLWLVAAGLIGYYIWHKQTSVSAAGTVPTTEASVVLAHGDSSPAVSTTASEMQTTTTLQPPALTVAAGGDVMGDRKVGTFIDKNGGAAVFAGVKPYMEPADIAFINLEGATSDKGEPWYGKAYTFRARPALVDGLVSGGVDVVSLANNHILDYRSAALLDCISRLDAAGISHPGAGSNLSVARTPAILETPAGTVAFLAASEITPAQGAGSDKPGTYYTHSPNTGLISDVTEASKQADFVIVSLHWGSEYTHSPTSHQITLAHNLVDAGADLILGHHPHVIQALELYKDRLIAYSLGDFVLDWHSPYCGEAFVLQVTMPRDGPPAVTVIPVYLSTSTGVPSVVTDDMATKILDRLTRLSADRGLELTRKGFTATIGDPPAVFGNPAATPVADSAGTATTTTITP